jgi:hypothetical protein
VKSTPEADAVLAGMEEGWNQSLDRQASHLGEVKGAISMAENHKENIPAVPAMKLELVPVPMLATMMVSSSIIVRPFG